MTKLNLENKLDEIKKIINCWSCRNLTLFGKVVILKTLVLSKIVNICSVIYVPDNFIKEVDALFFEFLWEKGKRPKVKKEITINDKVRGGIKMVDIRKMLISIKALWVKRLLTDNVDNPYKEKWKNLALLIGGISDKNLLLHKLSKDHFPKSQSKFYDSVLLSWYSFFSVSPSTVQEIMNEKIAYNKYITIGGMPLLPNFNVIKETGITKLSQLYQGSEIKSKKNLDQQYGGKVLELAYNSLVSAIPKHWKTKIMQKNAG